MKQKNRERRGLMYTLLPGVLAMMLCTSCFMGLSWALFADKASSNISFIQAGSFNPIITVAENTLEIWQVTEKDKEPEGTKPEVIDGGEAEASDDAADGTQKKDLTTEGEKEERALAAGFLGDPAQDRSESAMLSNDINDENGKPENDGTKDTFLKMLTADEEGYDLIPYKTYTLTVDNGGSDSVLGYCIITVDRNSYVLKVESKTIETVTIQGATSLNIEKRWGECAENSGFNNITCETITGESQSIGSGNTPTDERENMGEGGMTSALPGTEEIAEIEKTEKIEEIESTLPDTKERKTVENEDKNHVKEEVVYEDSAAIPEGGASCHEEYGKLGSESENEKSG